MNAREAGFLLLTGHLGDPGRKVLTAAQLRRLAQGIAQLPRSAEDRELDAADLMAMGYGREMARRILELLDQQDLLEYYCLKGKKAGCFPLTRVTQGYPARVRSALGLESPGCLWVKGDPSILEMKTVALVGSRDLMEDNGIFAREVGRQAALQGYALVSGNARGADQEAQWACLRAGGKVISVVADTLAQHSFRENVLYISEDGFDLGFSAQRALSRNRVIHSLGQKTFVAQCGYQSGGTWDGTVKNLRFGWSPVYCYADGSPAQRLLTDMGAEPVELQDLWDIDALRTGIAPLFE